MSGARERANGQASGPVLSSRFLAFLTHRASVGLIDTFILPFRSHQLTHSPRSAHLALHCAYLLRSASSFAFSTLLASLVRWAALIRSFARSLNHSEARGEEIYVIKMNASITDNFIPLWADFIPFLLNVTSPHSDRSQWNLWSEQLTPAPFG